MFQMPPPLSRLFDLIPDWLLSSPFPRWNDPQWVAIETAGLVVLWLIVRLVRRRKVRWRVKAARKILRRVQRMSAEPQQIAYLRKIDPFIFEELVLTVMKRQGHRIKRNKRYTGDGGIDGQIWIRGKRHLMQAKRYSGYIHKTHLHDFDDLCRRRRCKGLFVHTGKIGGGGENSETRRVTILNASEFLELLS